MKTESGQGPEHLEQGNWAERVAVGYLMGRGGYRLLERNWRKGRGELDLILDNRGCLVFVEVRSRKRCRFAAECYRSVSPAKRALLRKTALAWIGERRLRGKVAMRMDVVGIVGQPGEFKVHHWENVGWLGPQRFSLRE